MQWALDLVLIFLLAATLFHALRLERALGVLKRDRSALEQLVAGFNASTQQAEHGIERLRDAADGAGRQIARQLEAASALRDDLNFLLERGETLGEPAGRQRALGARARAGGAADRAAGRGTARAQPGRTRPAARAAVGAMTRARRRCRA